ncbi:DUF3857 domain-containing protein [Flavobacterium amniphilum]|uniref:DUF3857 domain-containing protein n=1 Tax=Flavobacterium amniphilum TaxID=1834035 RepID=UPI00202A1454|nr:DUF3857 domain-containing protein [Flavobacterium amniphilum]MCL9806724.1 DUF3857 domain-containing protein [Flavobacterium amniphilum]
MKLFRFLLLVCLFFTGKIFAQTSDLSVLGIPAELKESANSVVRNQEVSVEIKSISNMIIKTKKVITVFNEKGLRNIDANEHYNKTLSINSIEAVVYNSLGKELKKLKRKDFQDYSVAGDAADISETRVVALNYVPTEYPFTIIYQSEVQTPNTAFIPKWYPVDDFSESVQKSVFTISFPSGLGFKYKEIDFGDKKILKEEKENFLHYTVENFPAEKPEELAPYKPSHVIFGLDKFMLEGVEGDAKNWKDFGKWMNEKLLKGTSEIPVDTQTKIKNLIGNESDPIKKARIVYQYMQDKTRYVSIQLGIGGWKPMLAKDVDRLGYGDCKALSNYTKSLLEVVSVPSYYAIIYGGDNRKDIMEDFVSMQGNHAVLAVPDKDNKLFFLECTSQTKAFGFEGDFTDDRFALLIKPEGGEIIRTKKYIDKDNAQVTKGKIIVGEDGSAKLDVKLQYTGIQYDGIVMLETLPLDKTKENYKERWSNLNELSVNEVKRYNDKANVQYTEEIKLNVPGYIKDLGTDKMIVPNVLNQNVSIPQRYRTRKSGFEIEKGYYDEDTIEIEIPSAYKVGAKPEPVSLDTKFGTYHTEISVLDNGKIEYKRNLLIKKGIYTAAEYDEFRKFKEQIAKNDNSKILLQPN